MKVFAVTKHSCEGWEDSMEVCLGVYYNKEDAIKKMNEFFDNWIKDVDFTEVCPANNEKIWGEIERSDDCISLINEHNGWSCDHIVIGVEEFEIQ